MPSRSDTNVVFMELFPLVRLFGCLGDGLHLEDNKSDDIDGNDVDEPEDHRYSRNTKKLIGLITVVVKTGNTKNKADSTVNDGREHGSGDGNSDQGVDGSGGDSEGNASSRRDSDSETGHKTLSVSSELHLLSGELVEVGSEGTQSDNNTNNEGHEKTDHLVTNTLLEESFILDDGSEGDTQDGAHERGEKHRCNQYDDVVSEETNGGNHSSHETHRNIVKVQVVLTHNHLIDFFNWKAMSEFGAYSSFLLFCEVSFGSMTLKVNDARGTGLERNDVDHSIVDTNSDLAHRCEDLSGKHVRCVEANLDCLFTLDGVCLEGTLAFYVM